MDIYMILLCLCTSVTIIKCESGPLFFVHCCSNSDCQSLPGHFCNFTLAAADQECPSATTEGFPRLPRSANEGNELGNVEGSTIRPRGTCDSCAGKSIPGCAGFLPVVHCCSDNDCRFIRGSFCDFGQVVANQECPATTTERGPRFPRSANEGMEPGNLEVRRKGTCDTGCLDGTREFCPGLNTGTTWVPEENRNSMCYVVSCEGLGCVYNRIHATFIEPLYNVCKRKQGEFCMTTSVLDGQTVSESALCAADCVEVFTTERTVSCCQEDYCNLNGSVPFRSSSSKSNLESSAPGLALDGLIAWITSVISLAVLQW